MTEFCMLFQEIYSVMDTFFFVIEKSTYKVYISYR